MKEQVLEIETTKSKKKIKNPQKARIKDFVFFSQLEVMDTNKKWHEILKCLGEPGWKTNGAVAAINDAINKKTYVN